MVAHICECAKSCSNGTLQMGELYVNFILIKRFVFFF